MKTVIIAGKEIKILTIVFAVVVFYFGVLIGFLNWPIPEFLPEYAQTAVIWFSIGAIVFQNVEQDVSYFEIMWQSPKIICNKGIFTWDGSSREIISAGIKYTVFYGGLNALGVTEKNGTVFVCPSEMVASISKNKLIKAKLERTLILPPEFKGFCKNEFIMFGSEPDAVFGNVSVNEAALHAEIELWKKRNHQLELSNDAYVKLLSDKGMVNAINSPEVMRYIDERLVEG